MRQFIKDNILRAARTPKPLVFDIPRTPGKSTDIAKLFKQINDMGRAPRAEYAELLNEDDPDGPVVLRGKHGEMVYMMPREAYEEIRRMPIPIELTKDYVTRHFRQGMGLP